MNQRYIDYTLYNIWANQRLIHSLKVYPEVLLTRELVSSFPTIQATLLHIWFAETGWLSRLNGRDWEATKVSDFSGSNQELFEAWSNTSQELKDFTMEADLEKPIKFEHKGHTFTIPAREIVQTVCNHGSFHRGQVVMMMRQVGITEIDQTDYIEWVRQKEVGRI